jgi:SAM-dependent methyltransferase
VAFVDCFRFDPATELTAALEAGLRNEEAGTRARILDFYAPRLRGRTTVLDAGCGNGLSVDLLREAGYEAWGVDSAPLRRWQWRERRNRSRLAVADVRMLPFGSSSFDAVISSGVIEHIGVVEQRTASGQYSVTGSDTRFGERVRFLSELLRVLRPGGVLFIDAPNGLFPIDFWHATEAGQARWHSWREPFLPTPGELVRLMRATGVPTELCFRSPHGRLAFRQVQRWWYGRLLAPIAAGVLSAMTMPGLRFLARTPFNPFLVAEIRKDRLGQ